MITAFPQSENEKLIDAQFLELRDVIASLMIRIRQTATRTDDAIFKINECLDGQTSDIHDLIAGLAIKADKLQVEQDNIHQYFIKIFVAIQRIEKHTGCDKNIEGLDKIAEGKK